MARTFIIGDIHGCFDELMELVENVGLTENDLLISVGDIVDRGNKSKEVYDYFRARPHSIVLMGNHERKHLNGVLNYAQEIVKLQFGEAYPAFLQWLQTLPYYYETPEAIVVHAAFEDGANLQQQKDEVLSGTTAGERYLENKYGAGYHWAQNYKGVKPIVYGHEVVGEKPKIFNNTYGLDTGACHGGFLTALELPGFVVHQVKATTDHWKAAQKLWQIPVLKAKQWGNMEMDMIKRQLDKLAYIEDFEIKNYLQLLQKWVTELEHLRTIIFEKLYALTSAMLATPELDFSKEANKYAFKTFLFKCRSNNLKVEALAISLGTPNKITGLATSLGIETIPFFIK